MVATIDNVKSTTTHFIFKTYKEQGTMEDSSKGERIPILPLTFFSERVKAIPPSGIRAFFDLVMSSRNLISLGVGEPDFYTMVRKEQSYLSN